MTTTMVSVSNPAALNEEQLRAELERKNAELIQLTTRLHTLEIHASSSSKLVGNLCELQLAGRFLDLHTELERMAGIYKQMKAAIAARKTH